MRAASALFYSADHSFALLTGAAKRSTVGKSMLISVDLGESECTIDGQFVSNQAFTEVCPALPLSSEVGVF